MGKFDDIVDRPWVDLTLYAESIPHLLHWDLAYLWILEKQRAVRPDKWRERIDAWKYLVSLLVLDKLTINEVPIDEPLIDYTKPFGLESVSWVRIKGLDDAVGVLSPTVLVRPLPDYKRNSLEQWQGSEPNPATHNPQDLAHLLSKAMGNLSLQGSESFAARLASCIRREFNPQPTGLPPNTKPVELPFLDRLGWSHRNDAPRLKKVQFFVRTDGDISSLWIPRCEVCQALLTRPESGAPIIVDSEVINLPCPAGLHENQFSTEDFLVWLSRGPNAILWRRIGITSAPSRGFPPAPKIMGSDLEFQWNPGPLDGEMDKRFLRLRFSGRGIVEKSISEITYNNILVPGSLSADFKGLPFRSDSLDAVANLDKISVEVDQDLQRLTYRNIKLRGLPVEVDIVRGNLSMVVDSSLSVGLYPAPQNMPPSWKLYRAFLAGGNRTNYLLKSAGCTSILPWLAESSDGSPTVIAAETADGRTGACFHNAPPPNPIQNVALIRRDINVGIDFGTSNTLVYVAPPNSNPNNIHPEQFAIKPSNLGENVLWLTAASGADADNTPIGDFLPSRKHGATRTDPYIVPTAVWETNNHVLIRWSPAPPLTGMTETGNFKSDPNALSLRFSFVRELMVLMIPQMVRQAGTGRSEIRLNLGFAFPLAFGFQARGEMNELFKELKKELDSAGSEANSFSISESRACVRAFGTPRLDENFLVADMGGGTLDLALFTTGEDQTRNTMHQIGSLRYAGENYVTAFAQHGQGRIWKIRDSISSGASWRDYGQDPAAQKILQRFVGFAFEYLRTMLLAFKQDRDRSAIKLVLVGNGWHLMDAFSADNEQRGHRRVFQESYKHLVDQLAIPDLDLYLGDPLSALPSSKHLVVIGALRNSWGGQGTREIELDQTQLPKLPAGRGMQLGRPGPNSKHYDWFNLVGDDIALVGSSLDDLTVDSEFFLNDMPPLVDPWRKHLLQQFGCQSVAEIPYLDEMQIRDQIRPSIQGTPPRVGKGPLQIILEQSWIKKLDGI